MIRYFSITDAITEAEFGKLTPIEIAGKTYKKALEYYTEKTDRSAREALPIIKNVFENKDNQFERIVVPFTDGIKSLNVVTDLKKAYESEGKQLIADFEKNITLAIVDEAWKKHLRKMDELKQSVQLAVHEQKLNGVNKEVVSFLFKGDLPQQQTAPAIQEAKEVRQVEDYTTSKDEIQNTDEAAAESRNIGSEAGQTQQRQVTETIKRDMPKINRNDNVTIKHVMSGNSETMKYKKAESLLASGEWVIVKE